MKKIVFLSLILSVFLCSCSNPLFSGKKDKNEETGNVHISLCNKEAAGNNLSRNITPEGSLDLVTGWYITFTPQTGDSMIFSVASEGTELSDEAIFTVPTGTYNITVTSKTIDGNPLLYSGSIKNISITAGSNEFEISVSKKKAATGYLEFEITIGDRILISDYSQIVILLTDTATNIVYSSLEDADNKLSDLGLYVKVRDNIISFVDKAEDGEIHCAVKSSIYKLKMYYEYDENIYNLNIPDPYIEICDYCTTTFGPTIEGYSISREYYSTTADSSYNGLLSNYPINIETLMTNLKSDSEWNEVKIYFTESEEIDDIKASAIEKIANKNIYVYHGNDLIFYKTHFVNTPNMIIDESNYQTITDANLVYGMTLLIDESVYDEKQIDGVYKTPLKNFLRSITNNTKNITLDLSSYKDTIYRSTRFWNSATKIILPDNLTYLYSDAFADAEQLVEIQIDDSNSTFKTVDGILYKKNGDQIYSIIRYPPSKEGSNYSFPEGVTQLGFFNIFANTKYLKTIDNFEQITSISNESWDNFVNSSITELVVGEYLTVIPIYTFQKSKLTKITFPSTLTCIKGEVFTDCTELRSIVFNSTVPPEFEIANNIEGFSGCTSLVSIYVPEGSVAAYTDESTTWFTNNALKDKLTDLVLDDVYVRRIGNASALIEISALSNDTLNPETFENYKLEILNDITITSGWTPIATASGTTFKGTLNGNGHKISVPMIEFNNTDNGFTGLVGVNKGTIENIEYYIEGYSDGGDSFDETIMVQCEGSSGTNVWNGQVGGIAGVNYGTIKNCWNRVNFYTPFIRAGGIAGWNRGIIENCVNTGNIAVYNAAHNEPRVGGIAGGLENYNSSQIINCVNYGTVGLRKGYSSTVVGEYDGSICGGHYFNSAYAEHPEKSIRNCYYLENTVCKNWNGDTPELNSDIIWIKPSVDIELENLIVSGCGTFNSDLTITAGTASAVDYSVINCLTAQDLDYGTNLLDALNGYVTDNSSSNLKSWKTVDDKVLLDFTD